MFNLDQLAKRALREEFLAALREFEHEKNHHSKDRLYTINQVAKRLGKAHATVSKMVDRGVIKSTKDRRITEAAIEEYLKDAK